MRGDGGVTVAGEARVVGVPSWGKCTMPLIEKSQKSFPNGNN